MMLIRDSKEFKLDEKIVLSVAWAESRFTSQHKVTKYGCIGPLQIKVKYWCYKKSIKYCDTFYDGVKALNYYLKKFKPLEKAICYYNNSKKCKKSYMSNYTKEVLNSLTILKRLIKKK